MARFTRAELEEFRDAELPDLLGDDVRLLFVGINPGLWTAAVQTHFARPGNRFYPALLRAGIISEPVDPAAGMTDDDRRRFTEAGIAITNLAPRATARADELSRDELRAGGQRLLGLVERVRPVVVAVVGITAFRTAFSIPRAQSGRQPDELVRDQLGDSSGAQWWALPNPSGLNAHDTVDSLALAYAEAARAAGVGSHRADSSHV